MRKWKCPLRDRDQDVWCKGRKALLRFPLQGLDARRVRERFITTRPRKRKKTEGTAISSVSEYPQESKLTTKLITVERLIVRCLTCDVMEQSEC